MKVDNQALSPRRAIFGLVIAGTVVAGLYFIGKHIIDDHEQKKVIKKALEHYRNLNRQLVGINSEISKIESFQLPDLEKKIQKYIKLLQESDAINNDSNINKGDENGDQGAGDATLIMSKEVPESVAKNDLRVETNSLDVGNKAAKEQDDIHKLLDKQKENTRLSILYTQEQIWRLMEKVDVIMPLSIPTSIKLDPYDPVFSNAFNGDTSSTEDNGIGDSNVNTEGNISESWISNDSVKYSVKKMVDQIRKKRKKVIKNAERVDEKVNSFKTRHPFLFV
ncbi:hypothetical protein AX774_g511 [Zancudomyces culisetae]|uniref:Uncharacterized protein n=1 Tax=Zancudomyces culisetae TaxID=1213189 RepID=A0A1R1PYA2_ZANCU|nr:hypothetical protein AX774_g511 [Zancudomyces culisetae]|eukprot:OMH85930.1 hypothetical protein AX774_g511 [Zancudomyces culisetae]